MLKALMIPTRQGSDLTAGMWQLINDVGAVPKTLISDRESTIGGKGKVTELAAAFTGTLATRIVLAPPRDPEFKGQTERNDQYLETSFLPGHKFTSPADCNDQLTQWLPRANYRTVRSIQGRPIDRLPVELQATGFAHRVRISRDYSVRLDRNDYSVHPSMIGRLVDFTLTFDRVIGVCDQQIVADHPRCWAKHQVITDPEHVQVASTLRSASNKFRRTAFAGGLQDPVAALNIRWLQGHHYSDSEPPSTLVQSHGSPVLSAGDPGHAFHLGDNPLFLLEVTHSARIVFPTVTIQDTLWTIIISMHVSAIAGVPCFPVHLFGRTAGRGFRSVFVLTCSSSILVASSDTPYNDPRFAFDCERRTLHFLIIEDLEIFSPRWIGLARPAEGEEQ
ncbi:Mu transposase domain-containing protein [Glutamicibacter sp.]|uniref:Mu transposase domain-containing protein n=2 Tax=Glutamicibacter sp. TaxID=1931995 RepID=UPI002B489C3F|nr:hypothetical protein [Glutamicibacter sp.]HJX80352.1 hypothetical protein [Glutamicibacter sp.]